MISFQLHGVDELRRRLSPFRLEQAVTTSLKLVARELTSEVRKRTPEGKTGKLRRTLRILARGDGFVVAFAQPYAGFVEFGTRPHMIFPRKAKALRFVVGGRVVFAKHVRHPGTKGAHMVERTLHEEGPRMLALFRREVMRAMEAGP